MIKIGITSCLPGNEVRFDGQHKHDRFITGSLGKRCEFIPVCPEVEWGLCAVKKTNVLQHIMGCFRKNLDADEKAETVEIIGKYNSGSVALIVPPGILNHCVRKNAQPSLNNQRYMNPHPFDRGLLNHV